MKWACDENWIESTVHAKSLEEIPLNLFKFYSIRAHSLTYLLLTQINVIGTLAHILFRNVSCAMYDFQDEEKKTHDFQDRGKKINNFTDLIRLMGHCWHFHICIKIIRKLLHLAHTVCYYACVFVSLFCI